ncbi:MAG TPA: urea ABC transporter substrate-binding protein, partial [Umezawaea sp.]|nr:urea ABC transporter substrate-binding protein [Umezawaea sp.]
MRKRTLTALASATSLVLVVAGCNRGPGSASGEQDPIVVGSTLSLTGAFAATGMIHKIAGEEYVARLNAAGGLLGRKVEW